MLTGFPYLGLGVYLRGERINKKGLSFNSSLVDALIESGMPPSLPFTISTHPQKLQKEGSGWLRWGIVKNFEFVDVVSSKLGPSRCKP